MKILIGGNGFIGSHYQIKHLEKETLIVSDKKESSIVKSDFIEGTFERTWPQILDLCIKYIKANENIEIHHFAANVGVTSVINNNNFFNEELLLNYNMHEFLKNLRQKINNKINFIYYSSSEVYGNIEYQFENKPTQSSPIEDQNFLRNRYTVQKLFGEYYFNDICENLNIDYLVIRPYNVVGIGQREEFVIPKMVKDAILNNEITIYGDGKQQRVFIHVEDFINSVDESIDKILNKKEFNFKIINIANISNYISIEKLANLISDKVSYAIKELIKIEKVNNDIRVGQFKRIPDIERLYHKIKYKPQKKLPEILDEYIQWYMKTE